MIPALANISDFIPCKIIHETRREVEKLNYLMFGFNINQTFTNYLNINKIVIWKYPLMSW